MTDERPTDSEEGVLSPSDLDIADDDRIAEIEDGRYVVATGDGPPDPSGRREPEPAPTESGDARYGIDLEVSVDGDDSRYRTRSNDIVDLFSELVRWYATQIDDDLDPERVLGILVAESELPIGPRPTVETAMERHDLTTEDSIGELLDALSETQR
ncbi:DUF7500 family protein [Halalkalicoccus tibetensis]|uniref:Uncharacterized protein n=1 Tax=Halalkalicoccus tibetensis TaxID=175632 RepID=A0ABD5V410_9EURY